MPDFLQIGWPSSTASSLEIGSTLVNDGQSWGTDLLNDTYVQTVQAEGGMLAVELAPNRKITLPFIFKGSNPDAANQFLSSLQYVAQPGNVLDVRPEGASWITRFDIEGARVMANRDLRYHRQGLMQGTLELSTRPWGYTPTWMVAAAASNIQPFVPIAASVIGDLPAHSQWYMYFNTHPSANTAIGGLIIGQHNMPSYRTIWRAEQSLGGGNIQASWGMEMLGGNPSVPMVQGLEWAASGAGPVNFAQMNVAGVAEVQNLASSTRAFVHAGFVPASSVTGSFPLRLAANGRALSRFGFPVRPIGGFGTSPLEGQLIDFGEINKQMLSTPEGGATQMRINMYPQFDAAMASSASQYMPVDALVLVPNAQVLVVNNPIGPGGGFSDSWRTIFSATASSQVRIDSKLQRMWRLTFGGSALANELTGSVRGAWPLLSNNAASGGLGIVVAPLSVDSESSANNIPLGVPYAQASSLGSVQVLYQPRWVMFR